MAILLDHRNKRPSVAPSAYIAPNAVLCGDVAIGEDSHVLFGAILTAEGGSITIGRQCIVMEGAVPRGVARHPLSIADHVLVGPGAHLTGCTVEECAFLATHATVFHGAHIGARAEVRINGVVHLLTNLPADAVVPIGWVAVGNPATIRPPKEHAEIWAAQEPLNFPREVFGLERPKAGETIMPKMTERYTRSLSEHFRNKVVDC
jgi:carbonic anhydrase/acetyltransferase-like protein (isoleucine patch superfamily)